MGRLVHPQDNFQENVAIGGSTYYAVNGNCNLSGSGMIALGFWNGTISGINSIIIGKDIGTTFAKHTNSVIIGQSAGSYTDSTTAASGASLTNNVFIGSAAGQGSSGNFNVGIGSNALGGFIDGVIGSNNIELITSSTYRMDSIFGRNHDSKLNIQRTIVGDTSTNRIFIGQAASGNFSPSSILQVKAKNASDTVIIAQGTTSQTADFIQAQNVSNALLFGIEKNGIPYQGYNQAIMIGSGMYTGTAYDRLQSIIIGDRASNGAAAAAGTGNIEIGYRPFSYGPVVGNYNTLVGHDVSNNYSYVATNGGFAGILSYNVVVGNGANTRYQDNNRIGNVFIGGSPNGGNYAPGSWGSGSYNIAIGQAMMGWIPGGWRGQYGSYNIEVCTNATNNIHRFAGDSNVLFTNKLNVDLTIVGDTNTKRIFIGNASTSGRLSPDSTLQVIPKNATDKVFIVRGAVSQTANLIEAQNSLGTPVFSIAPSGFISGALSPTIITSTGGLTLTNAHHGYIIEQTGIVSSGTFTIGSTSEITFPGWNCMIVNIGSGAIVASGTGNTMRSPGYLNRSRTQFSSISIYRRGAGDYVLGGDLA